MSTATQPMTAEDLLRLPHDGKQRYELVEGELRTMSPAGYDHGERSIAIGARLYMFVTQHRLGSVTGAETGFIVRRNPDTVRAPDAAFVCQERLEKYGRPKRGFYPYGPDLAVEVLSPDERQDDIDAKVEDWFAGGARLVWLINPRRKTVTVYRSLDDIHILTAKEMLDGGDVVPGFSCQVAEIFA